jgi:hypothetical protein
MIYFLYLKNSIDWTDRYKKKDFIIDTTKRFCSSVIKHLKETTSHDVFSKIPSFN